MKASGMLKKAFLLIAVILFVSGCKKDSTPKSARGYFFDYRVSMSNKLDEATIINGYWGYVKEYKGDFQPTLGEKPKEPKIATNRLLFFEADWKDQIEATAITKNGVKFYDLSKISKQDIEPKITIYPNKKGFYQFDPNGRNYVGLIQVSKRLGYMNGGLKEFGGLNNELVNFDMRIDYDATF